MALPKIPLSSSLSDGQFITIEGPNGVTTGYSYDVHQKALYFKESQVIYPSFHGVTHIAEDPIPPATCDTPGLMSSIDKCRLDSLLQMRVGVLGFQGSGFPEDGGWMQGDIILAAGSGFITLERFGNVVRFTVDSPVPLNCKNGDQEPNKLYWVQDGTETAGICPPVVNSILPNVNGYGELKIFLFPELIRANKNDPTATTNNKDAYPALLFKRQINTVNPNSAYHEMVLRRDTNSLIDYGWVFSPPADNATDPTLVYYLGKDLDGTQIKFQMSVASDPNLLGAILYKGHSITKQMAVIVGYTAELLSTNNYSVRAWDTFNANPIGNAFTAKNVWQYNNPEAATTGSNPKTLALDAAIDILPIGTLVDLWSFYNGVSYNYYFSKKPTLNPSYIWNWVGHAQFGDIGIARAEVDPADMTVGLDASFQTDLAKDLERSEWGITGFDDPLAPFHLAIDQGITNTDVNYQHRAVYDTNLPGLVVQSTTNPPSNYNERPVYLWHRKSLNNAFVRADIGRPEVDGFTATDFIIRSPIDSYTEQYMKVIGTGLVHGRHYIRVAGASFHDLPRRGAIRVLPESAGYNLVFNYSYKSMFPGPLDITSGAFNYIEGYGTVGTAGALDEGSLANSVILISDDANMPYPGQVGDIIELLHEDYNATVVRCEFFRDVNTNLVTLQVKCGTLDVARSYEDDMAGSMDDLIRGLAPGYSVSNIYTQSNSYTGLGSQPTTNIPGFVLYDGGAVIGGLQPEYWNRIEIMVRDNQVWVWWNKLLIPPSAERSSALPTPVVIQTPYFQISQSTYRSFGKYGVKMFPGAKIRQIDIRTQMTLMNEFVYGQLNLI